MKTKKNLGQRAPKGATWYCEKRNTTIYCEACKTLTATPATAAFVAGLCGMNSIQCDVCGIKEAR